MTPDTIFLLSGLIATELTLQVCLVNVSINIPDSRSHILIGSSYDLDTIFLLAGLIANDVTSRVCPVDILINIPDSKFHIFIVQSADPDTIFLLSGLIVTELTVNKSIYFVSRCRFCI